MDVRTPDQQLTALLNAETAQVPELIESYLYKRKQVSLGTILRGLAGQARTAAVHAYFVKRDLMALKQGCYLATKLTLASVGQHGGASFSTGGDLLYALLSDNMAAINELAHVETPELVQERHNPLAARAHVYMLQLAIRGEAELLQDMIERVARKGKKHERSESAAGRDFFSLLLKRDQAGLQELVQTQHAHVKSADPRSEDFMSFLGTVETKLCWLKGIPVQIRSPLVPMELMPIEPLIYYDDTYEFLKPGWTPPQQGLLGKVSRLFS